jgi:hypothetical protein
MDRVLSKEPTKFTASGIIHTGPCVFMGFLLGTDGVNDPVITVYDGLDNTGQEIVPSCTYDASAYGLNGCTGIHQYCTTGLYIEITCVGAVEVVVQHAPYYPDGTLKWKG